MNEEVLRQYRKLLNEVEDLQTRINKLYDKDISTGHSTVRGSSKRFPYTEIHFGVWVDDPKEVASRDKLIAIYKERLGRAKKEALNIEQFINNIQDSELRQIFEYRYIDGKKLWEIANLLNMDRSSVGKKIRNYLNFPPIPINPII